MERGSTGSQEQWHLLITRKIDELNLQNQRLVSIAHQLASTSLLAPSSPPPLIARIEQDMRASFNALLEGVKEYFIVIDHKLKEIAREIELHLARQPERESEVQSLGRRLERLEEQLRKSQENESRLIGILEGITQPHPEPALLRSHESTLHEGSFRIFSTQEGASTPPYPRPYSILDPDPPRPPPPPPPPPPAFSCFPAPGQHSVRSIAMAKRSLRGREEGQGVNSTHRLSYMMSMLKE